MSGSNSDNFEVDLVDGKFMDGREHKKRLMAAMGSFIKDRGIKPNMVVVQVGDDPASSVYIKHKMRACQELGIGFMKVEFGSDVSEKELIDRLLKLNADDDVHGYIVQLPLPAHINVENVVGVVDARKDIDCFHPENVGRLLGENVRFEPPTPRGIVHLLKGYGVDVRGKRVVIVGKSRIVGTPLGLMLSNEATMGGTVVLCDKWTERADSVTREADVLVVCAGVRELVRREAQIKKGAVLIDVGIHRVEVVGNDGVSKRRIVGDIAKSEEIVGRCSMMSPSPGGCGCLTVAYLCLNVVKAYMNLVEGGDGSKGVGFCKDEKILG